jgi:hypothetical protein
MRRVVWFGAAVAAGVAVMACGGSSGSSSGQAPQPARSGASASASASTTSAQPARRGGPNLITSSEIQSENFRSAHEIIERLRPQMLRGRGSVTLNDATGSSTNPVVYVDNVSYGPLEALRSIPAMQIREIQYINQSDATTRWGTGHQGGVILILTKGGSGK